MTGPKLMAISLAVGMLAFPLQAQEGKRELVQSAASFLTNFHPLIQVNLTKRSTQGFGMLAISRTNKDGHVACLMCEELPTLENGLAQLVTNDDGSQGMLVRFTLREGLAWGDGTPVTTEDVRFTHEVATDPKISLTNFDPWTRATELTVVDDRTFELRLPEITQSYNLWDSVLPAHLERPIFEGAGDTETYSRQSLYNTNPTNPGLWNGGYVLSDYQLGTRLIWETNPHWPGPGPHIDTIIMSYRENSAAIGQALLAGEVDIARVVPGGIGIDQFRDFRERFPERFKYFLRPGNILERLVLNLDNPMLQDVRVRQALLYGIDRETIVSALTGGTNVVAHALYNENNPYHAANLRRYDYDPARARELLAEAGWTPGSDGICRNANNDRLAFDLVTTAGNQEREQLVLVVQDQLGSICVGINPRFVGTQEYNNTYRRRAFTGLLFGTVSYPVTSRPITLLHSNYVPSEANGWVGENFSGYRNERMDALLEDLEGSLLREDIMRHITEVQEILIEDLPILPLYFYPNAAVLPLNLVAEPSSFGPDQTWAYEWSFN